jgi:hypothetical protein
MGLLKAVESKRSVVAGETQKERERERGGREGGREGENNLRPSEKLREA